MAMIKCKECGGDVSSKAKACPKCGVRPPKRRLVLKGLMIFFFFMVMYSAIHGNKSTKSPEYDAYLACKRYVKNNAHDPSSVEFEGNLPVAAAEKDGVMHMVVAGRATNGFGALRRFATKCSLKNSGDSWQLVELEEVKLP